MSASQMEQSMFDDGAERWWEALKMVWGLAKGVVANLWVSELVWY